MQVVCARSRLGYFCPVPDGINHQTEAGLEYDQGKGAIPEPFAAQRPGYPGVYSHGKARPGKQKPAYCPGQPLGQTHFIAHFQDKLYRKDNSLRYEMKN
jgi:hypothetical protein